MTPRLILKTHANYVIHKAEIERTHREKCKRHVTHTPGTETLPFLEQQNREQRGPKNYYLEQYGKLLKNYLVNPKNTRKKYRYSDGYNESKAYYVYLDTHRKGWTAQRCVKHGNIHDCPDCGTKVFVPETCREKNLCVICGQTYTNKLVLSAMTLFNTLSLNPKLPELYLSGIVFTLPKRLWSAVQYDNFKKFNAVCLKTIKEYHKGVIPAGVSVSHTWHSRLPLGEWYPHVHSFWLNYGFNKLTGKFQRIANYYDVKKLRRIYKKNLETAYSVKLPAVNLRIEYVKVDRRDEKKRRKVVHMLSYAFRMPQKDVTEYARGVEWDRKKHEYVHVREQIDQFSDQQHNHVDLILNPPPNWRRVRWYGWLSDSVKAHYLEMLDLSLAVVVPPENVESRDRAVLCPKCGETCNYIGHMTIEQAIKKYGVVFYPWDPGGNEYNKDYETETEPHTEKYFVPGLERLKHVIMIMQAIETWELAQRIKADVSFHGHPYAMDPDGTLQKLSPPLHGALTQRHKSTAVNNPHDPTLSYSPGETYTTGETRPEQGSDPAPANSSQSILSSVGRRAWVNDHSPNPATSNNSPIEPINPRGRDLCRGERPGKGGDPHV